MEQGIYNLSNEEYHAHTALSSSRLKAFAESPAHYFYSLHGYKSTKALDIGSLFHDLILQGDAFVKRHYARQPKIDRRTSKGKAEYDNWMLVNSDRVCIEESDWLTVEAMVNSVMLNNNAKWLIETALQHSTVERSYFWNDPATQIACRAKPDIEVLNYGIVGDLKSTTNCSQWDWSKSAFDYGYHLQQAMYTEGISLVSGVDITEFQFIVTEKKAENPVTVIYRLNEKSVELGKQLYRIHLEKFAELKRKSGEEFTDFLTAPNVIELPRFAFNEVLQ